jgi:hypothetical protein
MRCSASLAGYLLLGAAVSASIAGCTQVSADGDKFAGGRDKNPGSNDEPAKKDPPVRFAEDREPMEAKAISFDGKRAMKYLADLCAIGPRISGSDGMAKQQEIIQKHFEKLGAKVDLQKFDGKQPSQKKAVPMVNMIVSFHPDAKKRIMFCGHYDTRPIADQEPRERDWRKPFVSANDGTSSVAFFMELGHHVKDMNMKVGLDFVIFDGEEFIQDNKIDRFFLGSNHFADQYLKAKREPRYIAAILLDLFAGSDAVFPVEGNSYFHAAELLEEIYGEAKKRGVKSFVLQPGHTVEDDHLALIRVGIPAIDIIDFDYKHWHKLTDTPDQCSGEKMAEVAKVLTAWVQKVK